MKRKRRFFYNYYYYITVTFALVPGAVIRDCRPLFCVAVVPIPEDVNRANHPITSSNQHQSAPKIMPQFARGTRGNKIISSLSTRVVHTTVEDNVAHY